MTLRNGFLGLGKESKFLGNQTRYMSSEQIEAATIATSLNQSHSRLIQTFTAEAASANALAAAYQKANVAAIKFANKKTPPEIIAAETWITSQVDLRAGTNGALGR